MIQRIVIILILAGITTGCDFKRSSSNTKEAKIADVVDVEKILNEKNIPSKSKAERLVAAGEEFLSPVGMLYAHEIFKKALEVDPENKKAQFYVASIAPIVAIKGLYTVMIQLYESKGYNGSHGNYEYGNYYFEGLASEWKEFRDTIPEGSAAHALYFDYDGPEIKSELDYRNFLLRSLKPFKELRQFLLDNSDEILEINGKTSTSSRVVTSCVVNKIAENQYWQSPCNFLVNNHVKFNFVDFEVFRHMVSGLIIQLATASSHNPNGIMVAQYKRDKEWGGTVESGHESLRQNSEFGQLLGDHILGEVKSLGMDLLSGMKWAYKNQNTLCTEEGRTGHFFAGNVCIDKFRDDGTPTLKIYEMIETALKGQAQMHKFKIDKWNKQTWERETVTYAEARFNPVLWFTQPVENLKSLLPTEYNECGVGLNSADPTFNGIFPDGDADYVISQGTNARNGLLWEEPGRHCSRHIRRHEDQAEYRRMRELEDERKREAEKEEMKQEIIEEYLREQRAQQDAGADS